MSKEIFEEKGGPHRGHAAGNTDVEKQASQLASDVKYKVKQSLGKDTKLNPAQVAKAYLAQLAKSPAPPVVKSLAKRKIMGEEYTSDISSLVEKTMINALAKVFIEGVQIKEEPQDEYLLQLEETEDRKYKIRVTDKKTGNTYVRMATRAKIAELRSNPNIASVEMTEYGEISKSEASKGSQTAAAKSGKDYDGDGKVESGAKEYRGAVHNAIQRKKGGVADGKDTSSVKEDFIQESGKKKDNKSDEKIIDVMKGKNNVNVSPSLGESKNITEKKMTSAEKKEEKKLKSKYDPSGMKSSMIQQYGEKKGPGVYFALLRKKAMQTAGYQPDGEVIEEGDCGCDEDPKLKKSEGTISDPREMKTKVSNVKNTLRSMGLKMSYEPEGEIVDEAKAIGKTRSTDANPRGASVRASSGRGMTMTPAKGLGASKPAGDDKERAEKQADQAKKDRRAAARDRAASGEDRLSKLIRSVQKNSYQPEGEVIDERRKEDKVAGTPRKPRNPAFELVAKSMGTGRMGVKPRGEKKVPGKKPPVAGQYGGPHSPAQKVAARRASAQRAQDMYKPRAGESD
jgi:hypothetical protein